MSRFVMKFLCFTSDLRWQICTLTITLIMHAIQVYKCIYTTCNYMFGNNVEDVVSVYVYCMCNPVNCTVYTCVFIVGYVDSTHCVL